MTQVVITSANYPHVSLPPYVQSNFSQVFFIVYILVTSFFFMNILTAVRALAAATAVQRRGLTVGVGEQYVVYFYAQQNEILLERDAVQENTGLYAAYQVWARSRLAAGRTHGCADCVIARASLHRCCLSTTPPP